MGTDYGNFHNFCRDTGSRRPTIPVCNLFNESESRISPPNAFGGNGYGGCDLNGIDLSGGRHLANLGSILLDGIAVLMCLFLIWRSNVKRAAVGRREMQLFLLGFMIVSICEIFTIGHFPLNGTTVRIFSGIHIGMVVATAWILMMNGIVGYQIIEDGTALSLGIIILTAAALFVGTGYIALDTTFRWSGYFDSTLGGSNRSYSLYTLYFLVPLVFIVVFFLLESYLVLRILGERRPMIYLLVAALLFAIGQIFQFVISVHICNGTNGKINGALFETLFNVLTIAVIWLFWSSITEDDWPMPGTAGYT